MLGQKFGILHDNALSRYHLIRCQVPATLDCHDSLFHSICFLVNGYVMALLRKCLSQTFCNAYLGKKIAIGSLHKHVFEVVEQYSLANSSWQTIIIDMSMPYAEGKIEDSTFSL